MALSGGNRQVVQLDPNLPPVQSEGYVLGSADAPVEVIEFADFECPACAQFATLHEPDVVQRLVNAGRVRLRFLDYPLVEIGHKNSPTASLAAACANEQGKFWEMHDAIFANQPRWSTMPNAAQLFDSLAVNKFALNADEWRSCMSSHATAALVQADFERLRTAGVESTPSFFIGDRGISGAQPTDVFRKAIDNAVAKARGETAPAKPRR
jgi:protein-disulfide isomerase